MSRQFSFPGTHRTALSRACSITTALLGGLLLPAYSQEARQEKGDVPGSPARYGPFDVLYGIRGSVVYDDNIYISHTNKKADVIFNIAPNITVGAGDYREGEANLVKLSYTPTVILFADQSKNNAIDHDALLKGQWRPGSWKFGLQQEYQNYSGAVVDVGNRVNRQIYTTVLSSVYEVSPRTSFELDGRQSINNYQRLTDFNEWAVSAWMDYELTPLLKTGLGITGGFVDVQPGVNQTYQQILARATYSLTELLDLRASAGGELREFQGGQKNRVNPVFTIGGTYRPLENTTLTLDAYRRSQTSVVLRDQNYTTSGFNVGVRQVFRENYALNLSGGYENSDYTSNVKGTVANRTDDYFIAQIGVDWNVLEKLTVGAFYQFRDNHSTDSNHSFDNHQVGLNVSYRF